MLDLKKKGGQKLPSVRLLIQMFRTSSATVQHVLKQLETEKQIVKIQGKGCFFGETYPLEKIPIKKSTQEIIEENFRTDFQKGFFKNNQSLLSIKEFAARYNVSENNIKKFLTKKTEENFVKKEGRSFYLNIPKAKNETYVFSEILFVTRCNSLGGFSAESERELEFLRHVYKKAGSSRYKLTLLGIDESKNKLIDRNGKPHTLRDFPHVVGAIISTLLVLNPVPCLNLFESVKYPISVWWEHPLNAIPKTLLNKSNWHFFNSTFGESSGTELGLFLRSRNNTRISYISPYHNSSWSKDRLAGLKKSGLEVVAFTDNEMASPYDFKQLARSFSKKEQTEIVARNLLKQKLKKLVRDLNTEYPLVCVNDASASALLELQEENEIKLPSYLISFDNSLESYLLRLDSFDFNTETLVEQMFSALNNPQIFKEKEINEIRGKVEEKN